MSWLWFLIRVFGWAIALVLLLAAKDLWERWEERRHR